jgi:hypothetical protein
MHMLFRIHVAIGGSEKSLYIVMQTLFFLSKDWLPFGIRFRKSCTFGCPLQAFIKLYSHLTILESGCIAAKYIPPF